MELLARLAAFALVGGGLVIALATRVPGGALMVFTGALLYGWQDGFRRLGWGWLAALALMAMAALFLELMAAELAGTRPRFSAGGLAGFCAGAVLGGIVSGPLGVVLGALAGAAAGEVLWGTCWGYVHRGIAPLAGFLLVILSEAGVTTAMVTLLALLLY